MRIEFYSTIVPDVPIEAVEWDGSFASYLDSEVPTWRDEDCQPVTVYCEGGLVPLESWDESFDSINVFIEPKGGVFKSLGSILGSIFNIAFGWLMPSVRSGSQGNSPNQGNQLEAPQGSANVARLAQIVPEIAGRYKVFPYYVTLPHRYYQNARDQILEFHVCIGPGQYQIDPNDVKIGDTPLLSLGTDAEFRIFEPGESVAGTSSEYGWHTVEEVGGTSSGTAGLELSTEFANRANENPDYYVVNGNSFERSGQYPIAWGVGTGVNVYYPRDYTNTTFLHPGTAEEPPYEITRTTGPFGHLPSNEGDIIISGDFDSTTSYRVRSVISTSGLNKTLELETLAGDPVRFPDGTYTYTYGANIYRTITEFNPSNISVSPAGFGSGESFGTRIRFAGGETYGEWTSEFMCSPTNTSSIQFDVFFPEGLGYVENNGNISPLGVGIEFQYKNTSTGIVTTYSRYYENNTLDQIGFTEQIGVAPGRYLCRMRRVGAEASNTQSKNKAQWYGLKSLISEKQTYPDWTTMMVRLRSGGRIAAQSENKINVVATRMLPELIYSGGWTGNQPTRAMAAYLRYIALSIGYTEADLDFIALRDLNDLWWSRGETFDFVFSETTAKDAFDKVLAAGMAELTMTNGLLRPVREGVRTVFEQSYSAANMQGNLKSTFRQRTPDDNDGVEVEYTDGQTWTARTVRCLLPGDQGLKIRKVKLEGVVNRTQAWRIGMRLRREQRYINWGYDFTTSLSGLNSEYKSYVPLFDDMTGFGNSARIIDIRADPGGALITMDAEFTFEPGVNYSMGFRRKTGVFAGPFPAYPGPSSDQIIAPITGTWPEVTLKAELPHVYIGKTDLFCFPALITSIQPRDERTVSLSAVNYDSRKYADDNNFPPD